MAADRASVLQAAARRRHDEARRRAVQALRRFSTTGGGPVSLAAVAEAAGVSRAWLYRQADLRPAIDSLRLAPSRARPARPPAERATAESLRQQLEALRALEAELRAENHRLREALARKLGEERVGAAR